MAAVFHSHLDNYPTSLLSANRGTTRNPLSRWDNTGKDWENESEDTKMKETVKTSRTAGYLEKIFRALNVKYFNGELEEPIITIQSTPRVVRAISGGFACMRPLASGSAGAGHSGAVSLALPTVAPVRGSRQRCPRRAGRGWSAGRSPRPRVRVR